MWYISKKYIVVLSENITVKLTFRRMGGGENGGLKMCFRAYIGQKLSYRPFFQSKCGLGPTLAHPGFAIDGCVKNTTLILQLLKGNVPEYRDSLPPPPLRPLDRPLISHVTKYCPTRDGAMEEVMT